MCRDESISCAQRVRIKTQTQTSHFRFPILVCLAIKQDGSTLLERLVFHTWVRSAEKRREGDRWRNQLKCVNTKSGDLTPCRQVYSVCCSHSQSLFTCTHRVFLYNSRNHAKWWLSSLSILAGWLNAQSTLLNQSKNGTRRRGNGTGP